MSGATRFCNSSAVGLAAGAARSDTIGKLVTKSAIVRPAARGRQNRIYGPSLAVSACISTNQCMGARRGLETGRVKPSIPVRRTGRTDVSSGLYFRCDGDRRLFPAIAAHAEIDIMTRVQKLL